jgi:ABC-type lipoprotein release transport system permease subunit
MSLGVRSASRGWRLLSAVALGMVMSVMLLAVVPVYTTMISAAQITAEVTSAPSTDRNIEVTADVASFWQVQMSGVDNLIDDVQRRDMPAGVFSGTTEYLEADHTFRLAKVNGLTIGTKAANDALQGKYSPGGQLDLLTYNYSDAAPHMKLYAGRLPQPVAADQPPEALVTPKFGARPGQTLMIQDPANAKRLIAVKVVGVWYPKDENDSFWNGRGFDTNVPLLPSPMTQPPVYPVLFERQTFERMLSFHPASPTEVPMGVVAHYIWFVNPRGVTVDNENAVITGVQTIKDDLNGYVLGVDNIQAVTMTTHLADILSQGLNLFDVLRLPLYSVAAQLVVMALLFIVTMTGMLIESQGGVIATLRSRGASMTQMLVSYLFQGGALALVGLIAGPFLAMALSLFVIVTFEPVARAAGVVLTPAAVYSSVPWGQTLRPALAGAGLGLAALLVSVWSAARADVLAFRQRQGRVDRPPFWQRYYLDLGLAALVIAGYSQLVFFGALGTRQLLASAGAAQTFDYVQTLTPALTMVVGALLVLRATPWLLRLGAWITARGRGATGMLALSQLSRASSAFNRLALLLALAIGVGLFALTFQTTIAHASSDQAYYLTGADERVVIKPEEEGTQLTEPFRAQFARMPGVEGVTPLYRTYGQISNDNTVATQYVDALGVDASTFARVAVWRADNASQTLPALMAKLQAGVQGQDAGDAAHPMAALVSAQFAQALGLGPGGKFTLAPKESLYAQPFQFVIVGVVTNFPTMYNEYPDGFIITNVSDYLAALANPYLGDYPINGPNEFLLKTTPDTQAATQRARQLTNPNYFLDSTLDARQLAAKYQSDPLSAGMTGLLIAGAALAALLALLALLAQAGAAARRRATQFAVLRTLGMEESALLRMLLSEQAMVYVVGALGGIAICALLALAALPFLSFNTSSYQPPVPDVPSPALDINYTSSGIFMLAILAMFIVALAISGFVARSSGLGKALRVGED